MLLRFTSCALNGPPLGIQDQSQKCNRHLERLDTHFTKLCRSIVGPPPGTGWTPEWHEILQQWNVPMNKFPHRANIKTWSHRKHRDGKEPSPTERERELFSELSEVAQHIPILPQERLIRQILRWCPARKHRTGRPHFQWESKLESYCR